MPGNVHSLVLGALSLSTPTSNVHISRKAFYIDRFLLKIAAIGIDMEQANRPVEKLEGDEDEGNAPGGDPLAQS